jgi:hypothetical protein
MRKNLRLFALREREIDPFVALTTPWSLVHFLSGAAAKQVGISMPWFFIGHAVYEAKDMVESETGKIYNSAVNSVGDQTVAVLGHILAPRLGVGSLFSKPFVLAFAASLVIGWGLEDTLPDLIG